MIRCFLSLIFKKILQVKMEHLVLMMEEMRITSRSFFLNMESFLIRLLQHKISILETIAEDLDDSIVN